MLGFLKLFYPSSKLPSSVEITLSSESNLLVLRCGICPSNEPAHISLLDLSAGVLITLTFQCNLSGVISPPNQIVHRPSVYNKTHGHYLDHDCRFHGKASLYEYYLRKYQGSRPYLYAGISLLNEHFEMSFEV